VRKLTAQNPDLASANGQPEFYAMRDQGFKNIENSSLLSQVAGGQKFKVQEEQRVPEHYCVCGLICQPDNEVCDKCQGKN